MRNMWGPMAEASKGPEVSRCAKKGRKGHVSRNWLETLWAQFQAPNSTRIVQLNATISLVELNEKGKGPPLREDFQEDGGG